MEEQIAGFPLRAYDPFVKPRPLPWLVDTLVQRGKIGALLGEEKSGKSRLLAWLIACLYAGRTPFGLSIFTALLPRRILYLAGEETLEDIAPRIAGYMGLLGAEASQCLPIDVLECTGLGLQQPYQRTVIEQAVVDRGYEWIVLEPMARLHDGEENSNDAMRPLHNWLRHLSNRYGTTVTLVHHTGKLGEYSDKTRIATWARGASDLATLLDTAVAVEPVAVRPDKVRTVKLHRLGRFRPVEPLTVMDWTDPPQGRGWLLG